MFRWIVGFGGPLSVGCPPVLRLSVEALTSVLDPNSYRNPPKVLFTFSFLFDCNILFKNIKQSSGAEQEKKKGLEKVRIASPKLLVCVNYK